jgi:hypothetical protein
MYRSIFLILCLLLPVSLLRAQVSDGGVPYSSTLVNLKSQASIPKFTLNNIDTERLLEEDLLRPQPYRYAVFGDTVINVKVSGKEDIVPGKGTIWRIRISSQQAKSMQIMFRRFVVPRGASVFLYNENLTVVKGAFTQKNMHPDSTLVLADFPGRYVTVEYFEPDQAEFKGEVIIGSISQAYKSILETESNDGYISVNCPEGKDVQLEKHAVCKMTFRSDGYSYLCSGALINNARNDGTPYFLTAHHCISKSAEASSLVAYFNYENVGCDTARTIPVTLTGSSLLSTADSSDYSLLLLNTIPPANAQPFYAGWNADGSGTVGVTGIHHPSGNPKKISIDYDSIYPNPIPFQWEGNSVSPDSSHWVVAYDVGITGGGSSGSPLFNGNREILGQLHGGSNDIDFYGRFSYSWHNKPAGYPGLQEYLDPDSTGIQSLGGYAPADNPPDAFFTLPAYKICLNAPVVLYDYSVFGPYTRNWTITPSTFVYDGGTSAVSPRPIVKFTAPGLYTVKLDVTNPSGADNFLLADALFASDSIEVSVISDPSGKICECDFSEVILHGTGASSYTWSINPSDTEKVLLDTVAGDTIRISPYPGFHPDSGYVITIGTVGIQGTCSDTVRTEYQVLKPGNDNLMNALELSYGKSILYDNICATVQTGEPIPPFTSCTSQISWCDEYGTGKDIVENSVWFRFIAPPSGTVRIWSTGMDNELAIYEANSADELLNGNFNLLAANDDRTTTDYHPSIRSVEVIPGKTYFLQVDGSGGGLEGSFYVHLYEVTGSGINDLAENNLMVYPQPALQYVFMKGDALSDHTSLQVEVYNTSGLLMSQLLLPVDQDVIRMDVSDWKPGLYLARIHTGKTVLTARILKNY